MSSEPLWPTSIEIGQLTISIGPKKPKIPPKAPFYFPNMGYHIKKDGGTLCGVKKGMTIPLVRVHQMEKHEIHRLCSFCVATYYYILAKSKNILVIEEL
jgi:hypothetical protein